MKKNNCFDKAVPISNNNISIMRNDNKCVNCGVCKTICKIKTGIDLDKDSRKCLNCGQCIQSCPYGALLPFNGLDSFYKNKDKTLIAYISPAVRTSFQECFSKKPGVLSIKKVIGALRMLGFKYVFDTTFGADLTVMEEALELRNRLINKKNLPLITSCCPSWIKYQEDNYSDLKKYVSTCKSPIGMMGSIMKNYFCEIENIVNPYTVAITPCTSKKSEIERNEMNETDLVLTTTELAELIKKNNIKYEDIKESNFDNLYKEGSGGGIIFGTSGGVTESCLRTLNFYLTGTSLNKKRIINKKTRGFSPIKEFSIIIKGNKINICIINGIKNAKPILEDIRNKKCKYHFIEIMNCEGGCIAGGGQPKSKKIKDKTHIKRMKCLHKIDSKKLVKNSFENENILAIYNNYLKKPGSNISKELLHVKKEK